ncbi:GNAT family protein [Micromonospora sp. NPDC005298]|uniref:GNAT family N-acetyltransferase n=1 Tax=Micromonospora sp. NPDC005298 TaxID=3156873 RepID=UPI0033BE25F3
MRPRSARRAETGPVRTVHDTGRLQLRQVLPAEVSCRRVDGHRHADWAPGYLPAPTSSRAPAELYEIVLTSTGRVIGDLGVAPAVADVHDLYYALEPLSRGQGYATEAVDALAARLLAEPGVSGVTATVEQNDADAVGVAIRAGFSLADSGDGARVFRRSA